MVRTRAVVRLARAAARLLLALRANQAKRAQLTGGVELDYWATTCCVRVRMMSMMKG